jgi:hypothetical protein
MEIFRRFFLVTFIDISNFKHFYAVKVFLNGKKYFLNCMFCWPCISIYLCSKNQLDALFIISLFRQSTSTRFGHICNPSSGGILYIYNNWYVMCFSVDYLLASRPTDSQTKKHTMYQLLLCVCIYIYIYIYIYGVYLLMMGYKYARNM